jgi:hypothetical protein
MTYEEIEAAARVLFAKERPDAWEAVDQGVRNWYMARIAKSLERHVPRWWLSVRRLWRALRATGAAAKARSPRGAAGKSRDCP